METKAITMQPLEDPWIATGNESYNGGSGGEAPSMASITNSITVPPYKSGSRRGGICPRGGYIWLTHQSGETLCFKTRCKSWRCKACLPLKTQLTIMRMSYGLSQSQDSALTTFTYQADRIDGVDAVTVAKDWRRLLKSLRSLLPEMEWFRVIELTKKGTPHLHVLMMHTSIGRKGEPTHFWSPETKSPCDCGDCVLREVWYSITGDSFIVDCKAVTGSDRTAGYVGKYLGKGFADRARLEQLGFSRRWSRSAGWPSEQLRMAATDREEWVAHDFHPGYVEYFEDRSKIDAESFLAIRMGTEMRVHFEERQQDKAKVRKIKYVADSLAKTNNTGKS